MTTKLRVEPWKFIVYENFGKVSQEEFIITWFQDPEQDYNVVLTCDECKSSPHGDSDSTTCKHVKAVAKHLKEK